MHRLPVGVKGPGNRCKPGQVRVGQTPSVVRRLVFVTDSFGGWMVCVGQTLSVVRWFVLVRFLRRLDGLCWSDSLGGWMVCVGQTPSEVR